jgi:hypothetical protein
MKSQMEFPSFDENLPFLNQFILELATAFNTGQINSWKELDTRVKSFFTQENMNAVEVKAPGWKKMASYSEGITLTHETCVFLGMFMLPEFQSLTDEQKQLAKWIVLFHDIDKAHIQGQKDTMHAFNSGVVTANVLPSLGFPVTDKYQALITSWSNFTKQAFTVNAKIPQKPDNQKLPEILAGISQLFGEHSPADLITKTVLLHISINVDKNYPTPAPLRDDEIKRFISPASFPLLKVMMLSDNEGWSLFNSAVREQQRRDTLQVFEHVQMLISKPQ